MEYEEELSTNPQRSESVSTLIDPHFSNDRNEKLVEKLEKKLEKAYELVAKYEDENLDLRAQLADYKEKEREFKDRIEVLSSLVISDGSHQRNVDLKRIYDQLLYKDGRIVELNNQMLEKERQILDLQEAVREQGEVASAKNKAVKIVNQRLLEIDGRHTKDASTETDVGFIERGTRQRKQPRVTSPGRAIPQLRLGNNGSPPPIDPAEDQSSYTTETATYDDAEREWSPSPSASAALNRISKKYRKKVTFDLKSPGPGGKKDSKIKLESISPDITRLPLQGLDNEFAQQIIDLTNENDELRRIIAEIERAPIPEQDMRIAQLEEEIENVRRNGKNQLLRARATAQARIKEFENKIFDLQQKQTKEVDSLNATNEALKSGRDFVLEENAKLLEELKKLQQKETDLRSELDGSVALSLNYRRELDAELRRIVELRDELKEGQLATQHAIDEKQLAYTEVDKLKDALFAQDDLIRMLEGDLIVYETQVGMLRDSLGASKMEAREQAKSKAVTAKVTALDVENQELIKKRNEEKLKTKALHVKIRYLEQERDELLSWIQRYENFDFPPRSLEDLKRLQTNKRFTAATASSTTAQPCSSVFTAPTIETMLTNDEREESVLNTTQKSTMDEIDCLKKQLEEIQKENERLEVELTTAKSSSSMTVIPPGNTALLGLLETIEDISMMTNSEVPILSTKMPIVDASDQITNLEKDNFDLRQANRNLEMEVHNIRLEVERLTEMKRVSERDYDNLKCQKGKIEKECEELKQLLTEKESELARAELKNELNIGSAVEWQKEISRLREENSVLSGAKYEMEEKLNEVEAKLSIINQQKLEIEQKLNQYEQKNAALSESSERLRRFEQENNRLDQLVSTLKTEVEQFQVEAELSRTCLDDLRRTFLKSGNASAGSVRRIPSIDDAVAARTAMEALSRTTMATIDEGPLTGSNVRLEQQQPVTFYGGNEIAESQNNAEMGQNLNYQEYQQMMESTKSQIQTENNLHAATAPPLSEVGTEAQYYQPQMSQPYEVQQQYDRSMISEQQQYELLNSQQYENPLIPIQAQLVQLQTQYSQLQTSYSQMQGYYEAREKELIEESEDLKQQIIDLTERLEKSDKSAEESFKESVQLQNDYFIATEKAKSLERTTKQLEETKAKWVLNEQELVLLRNQIERMENDYNQLRDRNTKLEHFLTEARKSLSEAESARNNLAIENRLLRETNEKLEIELDEMKNEKEMEYESDLKVDEDLAEENEKLKKDKKFLQQQLKSAEENVNDNTKRIVDSTLAAIDDEFDDFRERRFSVVHAETQCEMSLTTPKESESTESDQLLNVAANISTEQPQLSELLVNYVKETNNFNEFLSQDVESLFVLNNELASAADCLKGQVWALNEQLKKSMFERQEILDQMEKLEGNNSTVYEENERLKQELNQQQTKLAEIEEQNVKWKEEVARLQEKKANVEQAYGQLSEKYEQLQNAYDLVMTRLLIPKLDASTDPLINEDFFKTAENAVRKYTVLEATTMELKKDLEQRTMKIKELEQMIRKNVSTVKASFDGNSADVEAHGAKLTAHSAMIEIKKLLVEAADTLHKLPIDEAYDTVRKETELRCAERVQNAINFCEQVFGEMEKCEAERKECNEIFELPKEAEPNGIEYIILKLHERWRTKHHQLLESETFLENQQQICRDLESRLSDAHEKLAEFESRRSSESDRPRSRSPLSPYAQDFWNRILESFSQSCRATEAMDMRLSSTNALIKNALEQLDVSSNTANCAVASTKIQFAILAARLTAKQADNDALFRATSELANTNVSLQNQVDELQEKLAHVEEKQIESRTELRKPEEHARIGGTIAEKSSTMANVEATVPVIVKPKLFIPELKPLKVNVETEQPIVAEKVVEKVPVFSSTKALPKKSAKIVSKKERSPTPVELNAVKKPESVPKPAFVEDDWGWNDDTQEESSYATAITNLPPTKSNEKKMFSPNVQEKKKEESSWGAWDESNDQEQNESNDWGAWDDEPVTAPSPKKHDIVPKKIEVTKVEKKTQKVKESKDDWGWNEENESDGEMEKPVIPMKKLEKKPTLKETKEKQKSGPSKVVDEWGWGNSEEQEDSSVAEPKTKVKNTKKETKKAKEADGDDWEW